MQRSIATVTIPISATSSVATPVPPGFVLSGFITPAALTGTSISLRASASVSASSYQAVYDEATLYSVAIGTNRFVALDTRVTQGIAVFELVSNDTEAAARVFTAIYTKE